MNKNNSNYAAENFREIVSGLIKGCNRDYEFSMKPIDGGRNNRAFLIDFADGKKAFLKAYFQHPGETRNRLESEFGFLRYVAGKGCSSVPKIYGADFRNNLGLYEYVEGNRLTVEDIDEDKINQAVSFFRGINMHDFSGSGLKNASDAHFSLKDNIDAVDMRISKLMEIPDNFEANIRARKFVTENLAVMWQEVKEEAGNKIRESCIEGSMDIPEKEKCLSPSDFGFHNALLNNKNVVFLDFEYSGIDDPAKMVADFFSQPEVPVPLKYLQLFAEKVSRRALNPRQFRERVNILLPVCKIKWCCIMLNDFLSAADMRRRFALGENSEKFKNIQLEKTRSYLNKFRAIKEKLAI